MSDFKRLLARCGWQKDDLVTVGVIRDKVTAWLQLPVPEAVELVARHDGAPNGYFVTSPVQPGVKMRKGFAREVIGWRTLYADLDAEKAGSFEVCDSVIGDLSLLLDPQDPIRPAVVINSGGGKHPYWPVERDERSDWPDCDDPRFADAQALLKRWGRLVDMVAKTYGGTADSVFNLDRVLRIPDTTNERRGIRVTAEFTGERRAVTLDRLAEVLDLYGVAEKPEDRQIASGEVLSPEEWEWGRNRCRYVDSWVAHWEDDWKDGEPAKRHNWLLDKRTQLATAHRSGIVTEAQYDEIGQAAEDLLLSWRASYSPTELADVHKWAVGRAAGKTDEQVADELNKHDALSPFGCGCQAERVESSKPEKEEQTVADESVKDEFSGAGHTADGADALGMFFGERGGLKTDRLAQHLIRKQPCLLTAEGYLAFYRGGAYRVGKESLNHEMAILLRDKYRKEHVATIGSYIRGLLQYDPERQLPDHAPNALFNVANGMIDLTTAKVDTDTGQLDPKTVEKLPHDPKHLSSNQSPVEWDPDAECPEYLKWAKSIGIEDILEDLEEAFSQMLDPSRTPSKVPFLYGPTRSGKSTCLRLMERIAGPKERERSAVTLHALAENRFAPADLYNKVLNTAADLSERHVADLSMWRMLTGEDTTWTERKNEPGFHFTNRALFAFSANTPPTVEDSEAYMSRVKPFRFGCSFLGHEDPAIEAAMVPELPGILVRLVAAWARVKARGHLNETAKETANDFAALSSRVADWVLQNCDINPIDLKSADSLRPKVPTSEARTANDLLAKFNHWTGDDRREHLGRKAFVRRLTSIDGVREVVFGQAARRGFNVTEVPFTE